MDIKTLMMQDLSFFGVVARGMKISRLISTSFRPKRCCYQAFAAHMSSRLSKELHFRESGFFSRLRLRIFFDMIVHIGTRR
jgi:hypothetical protein